MTNPASWLPRLAELVQAGFHPDGAASDGAELTVVDEDSNIVFRRPLARHTRVDLDCVWVRPIIGDGPSFDLVECRRRGLPTTTVRTQGETLVFELGDGAHAAVGPIGADLLDVLDRWDTFVLVQLDAAQERELADLATDT